ncbi:MAG: AraC family ligand binding domain-containing protein, partial [Cetobacterium sp.]
MKKNELITMFSEKNSVEIEQNEVKLFSVPIDLYNNFDAMSSSNNFKVLWENIMGKEEMISIRKHTRFIDIPNHSHNFIELFFVLQGSVTHKILGTEIKLREGELIFLNQGISHEIKKCSGHDIAINIIIRPKFFESIFNFICFDSKIRDFFLDSIFSYRTGNGLFFKISAISSLQKTMLEIISEFLQQDDFSKYRIQLLISLLITDLAKYSDSMTELNQQSYTDDILIKILNYIETKYPFGTLDEISRELNLPNYHISKLVKTNLNANFSDLIQSKRLEKA